MDTDKKKTYSEPRNSRVERKSMINGRGESALGCLLFIIVETLLRLSL